MTTHLFAIVLLVGLIRTEACTRSTDRQHVSYNATHDLVLKPTQHGDGIPPYFPILILTVLIVMSIIGVWACFHPYLHRAKVKRQERRARSKGAMNNILAVASTAALSSIEEQKRVFTLDRQTTFTKHTQEWREAFA